MKDPHEIIDQLSSGDALAILQILARDDDQLAARIAEVAIAYLSHVDPEGVAAVLYDMLNYLDVREVWNRAGRTRHGYVDPSEAANEMVEEVIEPFLRDLKKYQKLGMYAQANQMCMGMLLGLYQFECESTTEFKDWAGDVPSEFAWTVIDAWKEGAPGRADVREVKGFIDHELDGWVTQLV